MHYYNSHRKPAHKSNSVWKRKTSDIMGSFYPSFDAETDDVTINELKSVTKKATIISRLSAKNAIKNQFIWSTNTGITAKNTSSKGKRLHNKTQKSITNIANENAVIPDKKIYPSGSNRRPSTTAPANRIDSLQTAKQAYKKQKTVSQRWINSNDMGSFKCSEAQNQGSDPIKQGLLGQYQRYEKLTKNQLIQKLISLEYLANGIFRKNKVLQQKIRDLQGSNMMGVQLGTQEMSEKFQF